MALCLSKLSWLEHSYGVAAVSKCLRMTHAAWERGIHTGKHKITNMLYWLFCLRLTTIKSMSKLSDIGFLIWSGTHDLSHSIEILIFFKLTSYLSKTSLPLDHFLNVFQNFEKIIFVLSCLRHKRFVPSFMRLTSDLSLPQAKIIIIPQILEVFLYAFLIESQLLSCSADF